MTGRGAMPGRLLLSVEDEQETPNHIKQLLSYLRLNTVFSSCRNWHAHAEVSEVS